MDFKKLKISPIRKFICLIAKRNYLVLIQNTDPHWIGCPVGILYNKE